MTQADDAARPTMPGIRIPTGLTLAGLVAGLALGIVLSGTPAQEPVARIAGPVGTLWLNALKMTIVPLVAGLLFTGVVQTVAATGGGALARRTMGLFVLLWGTGTVSSALLMPLLLEWLPIPARAVAALHRGGTPQETAAAVPEVADFVASLVPQNVIAAAAAGAMLPLVVFVAVFALAATRLPPHSRRLLTGLFDAVAAAMMVVIGWVLVAAPLGVFALGFGVAAASGLAAVAALGHYVALVAGMGGIVFVAAYGLVAVAGRTGVAAFARAVLPVQALALSTQSSLACLPAMVGASRRLGVREGVGDFVLPLAVTVFRATSPAMNLAVAIYAARLSGVPLTPATVAIGVAVALVTTIASVSLPGTISFVASVAPIALAMGVPLEPLALLVAVEVLPDLMRTVGNVTADVAITVALEGRAGPAAAPVQPPS